MSLLDTFFNAEVMMSSLPALLRGFLNTLLLGLMSIGIGVPVGLLISLVRLYAPRPLRLLAIGYIDIFRAMPMLVVLILIYYALPFLGIRLSSWASAVTAFSIVSPPIRPRSSAPASKASRRASSRRRRRSACRSC